jgi:hypothetical protein
MSRGEVLHSLKEHLPGYEKGSTGIYAETKAHLGLALERAARLNTVSPFEADKTFTHVSVLVERLQALKGGA